MGDILFRFGRGHINITPEGWSASTGRFCCWPSLRKRSRHTIHIPPWGAIDCSEDLGNWGKRAVHRTISRGAAVFLSLFLLHQRGGEMGLFGVVWCFVSSPHFKHRNTLAGSRMCFLVVWFFFLGVFSPHCFKNIGSSFWDSKTPRANVYQPPTTPSSARSPLSRRPVH